MRFTPLLIISLLLGGLFQAPLCAQAGQAGNHPASPAEYFIEEWDELGRAILRWDQPEDKRKSWMFGAIGLYALQAGPSRERPPLPALQSIIPRLWPDTKHLTYNDIYTIADGILNQTGDMVAWRPDVNFESLNAEQQTLACLTGMRHLVMLSATIGDSSFWSIVRTSVYRTDDVRDLTDTLLQVISEKHGPGLSNAFAIALASPDRTDLELRSVEENNGWYTLDIRRGGAWTFPFDILAVTKSGDSLVFNNVSILGNTFRFFAVDPIRHIELDPNHDLVEVYRFNNHWPRVRGNLIVQPFYTLPNWEELSIAVSPVSWHDWGSETRYGLKFSGGFGINLMPAYPADYRHRFTLELNSFGPVEKLQSWGVQSTYNHPLSWSRRIFFQARSYGYRDWTGYAFTLTGYPGNQRYLIQGPDIRYRRVLLTWGGDNYEDAETWEYAQRLRYLRLGYNTLALTDAGNRLNIALSAAVGESSETELVDDFFVLRSRIDLAGVFMNWLVGDLRLVGGVQSEDIPPPYRFTHSHYWNSTIAWLPRFRGQPRYSDPVSQYLGVSFSTGYWMKWIEVKGFASSFLYGNGESSFADNQPRHAAGFGLEHRSFFTAAMYFPIWQSHPLPGEDSWAWRVEWQLEWNL